MLSKIPKKYFLVGKALLFLALLLIAWNKFPTNWHSISWNHWVYLVAAALLMPLNWLMELKKWSFIVAQIDDQKPRRVLRQSFAAGIISGMYTPNMQGNFLGRFLYFESHERPSVVGLTLIANYAQLLVTLICGGIAVFIVQDSPMEVHYKLLALPIVLTIVLAIGVYFACYGLFNRIHRVPIKWMQQVLSLGAKPSLRVLWCLFYLSAIRFLVFTIQFAFLLYFFTSQFEWQSVAWIWQFYFWVTLAPSLMLGKLVVRESIAVWVLTAAGFAATPIVLAAFTTWVINLGVPTVLSLIYLKRKHASNRVRISGT